MKKKQILKLLSKEIDQVVPKLDDRVLSTPIEPKKEEVIELEEKTTFAQKIQKTFKSKKTWGYLSSVAAVLIVVILAVVFMPQFINQNNKEKEEYTCFVVDINPSVMVTTDKEGNVVNVSALNKDGDVLLASGNISDGSKLETCIENIINISMQLGYIDMDSLNNAVSLSIYSNGKNVDGKIESGKSSIEQVLKNKGVYGFVIAKDYALEELNKKINIEIDQANILGSLSNIEKYTYERKDKSILFEQVKSDINKEAIKLYEQEKETFLNLLSEFVAIDDYIREEKGYDFFFIQDKTIPDDIKNKVDRGNAIIKELKEKYSFTLNPISLSTIDHIDEAIRFIELYINAHSGVDIELDVIVNRMNKIFGADNKFSNLLNAYISQIPQDEENIMQYMQDRMQKEYEKAKTLYQDKYTKQRNPISEDEYNDYVQSLIVKYGSLENYLEILNNNQ